MALAKAVIESPNMAMAAAEGYANSIVNQYSGWATTLMKVVEEKELYTIIGEKKYLEFEAWQLIGTFDRACADTNDVTPVERGGEIVAYICHANILKDGVRVGGASQMCGLDAFPCRGKEGSAKDNAAISAAQTWAASKAFKMLYSAVAVLGGYGAATAEEMRRAQEEAPDQSQHYCTEHKAGWFKRGKMRHFAHPIGDTKEWCNEPIVILADGTVPTAKPATTPGFCYGHQIKLGRHPTEGMVHRLQDGSWCHGVAATPREAAPQEAEAVPQFADTPLGQLQRDVYDAEIEWETFETTILHMTWPEWVKLGGDVGRARQAWTDGTIE